MKQDPKAARARAIVPALARFLPLLRGAAYVFGLAALVVAGLVLVASLRLAASSPLDSAELARLKVRAAAAPAADPLIEEARALDLLARTAYFSSQAQITEGLLILAILAGLAIACAKLALGLETRWEDPKATGGGSLWAGVRKARKAYAIAGLVLLAGALGGGILAPRDLALDARNALLFLGIVDAPPDAERDAEWPQFRGSRAGVAGPGNEALALAARLAVAWKVEAGLAGFNSPAVWGGRLYYAGADAETQAVYCRDAATGALLWRRTLEEATGKRGATVKVAASTGYAAPSLAVDGRRVYALFACGVLLVLDREGALAWRKDFGVADNPYGIASSPALWKDQVFIQWHQADQTALYALHAPTGKLLWRAERKLKAAWTSPVVARASAGEVLVVAGNPLIEAFDPLTGRSLWSLEALGGEPTPSAAWEGDLLFAGTQYARALGIALAPGAGGGAGAGAKLWEFRDQLPDIASLLAAGGRAYMAATFGMVSCLDLGSGRKLWQQRWPGEEINSSPVAVADQVFLAFLNGTLRRFRNADGYEETLSLDLGEAIKATPAVAGGAIYLRTESSIVKLEAAE